MVLKIILNSFIDEVQNIFKWYFCLNPITICVYRISGKSISIRATFKRSGFELENDLRCVHDVHDYD